MSTFDLVIRGGTVVTATDRFPADIGVRGGCIVALGEALDPGEEELDASGKLVLPGGIDSHVHLDQPRPSPMRPPEERAATHRAITLAELAGVVAAARRRGAAPGFGPGAVRTGTSVMDRRPGTGSMTRGIGYSVARVEDHRLLRGRGRFTDDINLPGPASRPGGSLAASSCPDCRYRHRAGAGGAGGGCRVHRCGCRSGRPRHLAQPRAWRRFAHPPGRLAHLRAGAPGTSVHEGRVRR